MVAMASNIIKPNNHSVGAIRQGKRAVNKSIFIFLSKIGKIYRAQFSYFPVIFGNSSHENLFGSCFLIMRSTAALRLRKYARRFPLCWMVCKLGVGRSERLCLGKGFSSSENTVRNGKWAKCMFGLNWNL